MIRILQHQDPAVGARNIDGRGQNLRSPDSTLEQVDVYSAIGEFGLDLGLGYSPKTIATIDRAAQLAEGCGERVEAHLLRIIAADMRHRVAQRAQEQHSSIRNQRRSGDMA